MDFKEIKELIRVFDKSELNKLKVKEGEFEISLGKGVSEVNVSPIANTSFVPLSNNNQESVPSSLSAQTETTCIIENNEKICSDTINSPMIGTFYASPSPESPSFVKVGDTVKKGQTLCILEAMKIMNEVEAETDCRILEVLVNDSDPVEYDMPLFKIEKI